VTVLYQRHSGPVLWSCADCGHDIDPPAVYWAGAIDLILHPGCASRLGAHFQGDAREALLAGSPAVQWRQRAVAVTRHRLLNEEAVA
jgi:hypothetical protein